MTEARSPEATSPASPRDRLLQAAREVVAADGLEGLTLRAIARHAGVSHGAPLRHFPSLAALLAAVAADGFTRLMASIDTRLAEADEAAAHAGATLGGRERLAVAGRAYVEFALADPGVFSVTFRPERVDVTDDDYLRQGMASFAQLVGLVEAAQADGWHAGRPAADLAAVLWANVHGLAVLALHGALPAVVGADAMGRLPALSALLTLGVDPAGTGAPGGTSDDPSTPSTNERRRR
ncbi:MAG: TetR/AcrR family transcriptional regulator [Acidimicrobiales bacterium]|nr:TetR/AcrR family transcriptional regulator [Acidimicrobiales bacterium]